MKQYVFIPLDNSFKVSYLTNGIGTTMDRLMIQEIKSEVAGVVTPGLCAAGQALGLFHDYLETTHKTLLAKAVALNMNLLIFETGQASSNINEALCDFLTFTTDHQTGSTVINHTAKTVALNVPYGTTVTGLTATFTTTNSATVKISSTPQVSGVTTNDFTRAVTYRITAKNTTTYKDYTVTVTVLGQ